jgi:hypothetical protein
MEEFLTAVFYFRIDSERKTDAPSENETQNILTKKRETRGNNVGASNIKADMPAAPRKSEERGSREHTVVSRRRKSQ